MFKLFAILAVFAVTQAAPGPGALIASPLLAKIDAPEAPASTEHAAHVAAFAAPIAPIAYSQIAYAAPGYIATAPIAYTSGYHVQYSSAPIEQHGYRIAY